MTVTVRQLRETLIRYVRDADFAANRNAVSAPAPAAVVSAFSTPPVVSRIDRLKQRLRDIPVIAPLLVTAYRLIKLPGRVALIVRQLQTLQEHVNVLARLHERLDAQSWTLAAIQTEMSGRLTSIEAAAQDSKAASQRASSQTADSAHALVALHEKSDRYQQELYARFAAIKPVIHAGGDLIVSRVEDFIMAFPTDEWRLPVYQILVGHLEPGLVARMKSTIKEGMTVVDVGANVGTYTLLALKGIGTSGSVISYEPTPRVFDILTNNVRINGFLETGRVHLWQKAVSDGSQSRSQFFLSSNSLMNSLYGRDPDSRRPVETIDVETVSLDHDLEHVRRVDVIKIDAEGAEPMILQGMRRIIERSPEICIFIEFAPTHLVRANIDPSAFLADIHAQALSVHEVVEPSGELRPISDVDLCKCFSVNLMLRRAS